MKKLVKGDKWEKVKARLEGALKTGAEDICDY